MGYKASLDVGDFGGHAVRQTCRRRPISRARLPGDRKGCSAGRRHKGTLFSRVDTKSRPATTRGDASLSSMSCATNAWWTSIANAMTPKDQSPVSGEASILVYCAVASKPSFNLNNLPRRCTQTPVLGRHRLSPSHRLALPSAPQRLDQRSSSECRSGRCLGAWCRRAHSRGCGWIPSRLAPDL